MSRGGVSSDVACDPVRGIVVIPRSKKREPLIARLFAKLLVKEKEPTRRRDRFESRAPQLPMVRGKARWPQMPPYTWWRTQQSERIMPITHRLPW